MKKLLILLLLLLLTGCQEEGTVTKVNCNEMKKLLADSKAVLVDVRSKEEYDEGHLENAINGPLTKLSSLKDDYNLNLKDSIIVYCKSGVRSNDAAKMLLKLGYKNIYDLGAMSNCLK